MRKGGFRIAVGLVCALTLLVVALRGRDASSESSSRRGVDTSSSSVQRYRVFERTFPWRTNDSNPWEQVNLTMTLTSPSRLRFSVGGFYYRSNTWKVRFAPYEIGRWHWSATLRDQGRRRAFRGAFTVVPGGQHGFVRRSPYNRFRWTFADRTPYYPLGIGDCVGNDDSSSSPFEGWGLDGGRVDINTYLRAYQHAGVNLFRWSVDNCSFKLYRTIAPAGNIYLEHEGTWGDEFVRDLRAHGFRVYMAIFGFDPPFANGATGADLQAVERYVKYVVDRYGAYVDFWELMNEATASGEWYTQVARYLRRIDPYHHPISTSWERPLLPVIDINSPHWYQTESEFDSDRITWQLLKGWKQAGKPVIVGEQGNAGHNWDAGSALRMRLRTWTAFFGEGSLIFWNTSHSKGYRATAGNIYLGPEERGYLRVLQDFTRGFDARARIAPVVLSPTDMLRGYALRGPRQYAAYLHDYREHGAAVTGASLTIKISRPGIATWISPATGAVLGRTVLGRGGAWTLHVPSFVTDVALKIR